MAVEAQVSINGSAEAVWSVISDIHHAADRISGIDEVEVLEQPAAGLVGLKWRETRTMFGKTATEVMWITEAVENEYYKTRAESHGCVYISTLRITNDDKNCTLTMSHQTEPQGLLVKMIALPMGVLFKGMMRKAMQQDLDDIKTAVEHHAAAATS